MKTPEVFYLHIQGEQRGPYSVQHIDHLLHSGLIAEETLFWREGLEEWQPVRELVPRRGVPRRRWLKSAIALGIVLVLAFLAHVFGPTVLDGWREADQRDFTAEAAYWRARDAVRQQVKAGGGFVAFAPFDDAKTELGLAIEPDDALVLLPGELADSGGQPRPTKWDVRLHFEREKKTWTATSITQIGSNP